MVSENRLLRKIFGLKMDGVRGKCRRHIRRNFEKYTLHEINFGISNQ